MAGFEMQFLSDYVIKRHESKFLFIQELIGYTNCHWAAPKLLGVDVEKLELRVERCTPLIEIPPNPSHAKDAWDKLQALHDSGWNHRDAAALNMVLHPTRGVLLIDWETVYEVPCVEDSLSFDLYGATNTYVDPEWVAEHLRPDGVWWHSGRPHDPGVWWGVDFYS